MRPVVPSAVAASIDAETKDRLGLDDDLLMETAAEGLYRILQTLPSWDRVEAGAGLVAVCGKGNNGGDALATARKAVLGGAPQVAALVPPELNAVSGRRLEEARRAGVRILSLDSPASETLIQEAALVLDGIAGTGLRGRLRPPYDRLAARISGAPGIKVAIDVPSGTCQDAPPDAVVVKADYTLCIAPSKLELYMPGLRPYAGTIREVQGVFPANCARDSRIGMLSEGDLPALVPVLPPEAHKGSRGALGIYAGSMGSTGAAVLAARAGSASGAGTVSLLCRDELWQILACCLSAQMVRPLSSGPGRAFSAVLAGPGWGIDTVSLGLLEQLLKSELPLVLDADALRILADSSYNPARLSPAPLVLTPHPGEFIALASRMQGHIGDASYSPDPRASAKIRNRLLCDTPTILGECAAFYNAVVILKNHVSWIASPDGRLALWDGQEPALGTGGSGDVLAGLVAGLLARGADAFDAACAGVVAHGLAGRAAAEERGFFEASDLPAYAARILYKESVHGN